MMMITQQIMNTNEYLLNYEYKWIFIKLWIQTVILSNYLYSLPTRHTLKQNK